MDFSDIKSIDQISAVIKESIAYIRKHQLNLVIGLTNLDTMFFNNEVKNIFATFLSGNKPYMKKVPSLACLAWQGYCSIV